jgi:lipopolysaccharide/colanic/teichoic acid biosynthesis glycosyltransferase
VRYAVSKRGIDLLLAVCGLIVVTPILLVAGIAIVVESPGSIVFTQVRVGYRGRLFNLYKLRTMVPNAAVIGPYSTSIGDKRVLKIGRLLRRFGVDELPQLFNVIRGDMSLVGPRPDVPAQRDQYTPGEWQHRHSVKPGVTGLAQATLRSSATLDQRKALDCRYVVEASLALDLRILWLTVLQTIKKGGY